MVLLRRADGHPFTTRIDGVDRVAVWRTADDVDRYRARNPVLSVYRPIDLEDRRARQALDGLGGPESVAFLIMSEDNAEASLTAGEPTDWTMLTAQQQRRG